MVTRETSIRSLLRSLDLVERLVDVDAVVQRIAIFARLLDEVALPRGYLGPSEDSKLLVRHIGESLTIAGALPAEGVVIDVGSGAGLPGLPLAALGLHDVVLVEPVARRSAFLRRAVHEMSIGVRVVAERAEVAARSELRDSADVAVARALAPPEVVLELTLPFVKPGGSAVILVGQPDDPVSWVPAARGEGAAARQPAPPALMAVAHELGGADPTLSRFEVPGGEAALWVMIVAKSRSTPEGYPRRPGIPRRRPLGGLVKGVN